MDIYKYNTKYLGIIQFVYEYYIHNYTVNFSN
jgi:hypothetical protein